MAVVKFRPIIDGNKSSEELTNLDEKIKLFTTHVKPIIENQFPNEYPIHVTGDWIKLEIRPPKDSKMPRLDIDSCDRFRIDPEEKYLEFKLDDTTYRVYYE